MATGQDYGTGADKRGNQKQIRNIIVQKLSIKKYGRFSDREFELSPVTVFYGGNESGKTTIFDALFEQICSKDAKRSYVWRRISQRYGDIQNRQASADVAVPYENGDEYLSLFAIRSSDLSLNAGRDRDAWVSAAGRNLFFHGIDVLKMAENLRKTAAPSPVSRDAKNFAMLEDELKRTQASLALKLELERKAVGQKKGLGLLDQDMRQLEAQAAQLKEELARKNEQIENLKKQRKLAQSIANREMVGNFAASRKFCENNPYVSQEGLAEYDSMVKERDIAKANYDAALAKIQLCQKRLEEIEGQIPAQEQKRKDAELLEGAAGLFKEQIQAIFALREENDKFQETPAAMSFVPVVIILLGIILGVLFHTKTIAAWLLVPAGFFFAWLFYKNCIRRRDRAAEKAKENQMLSDIIKSWGERFDITPIQNLPPEQVLAKFTEFDVNAEKERNLHLALLKQREECQMAITDANAQSTGVQIGYTTARESTAAWLSDKGFADRDSYIRAVEQKKVAEQFVKANSTRIDALMLEEACMSVEALLALLDSRVKTLAQNGMAGINPAAIENEISRQEQQAQEISAQIRDNAEKCRQAAVDRAKSEADFENACAALPDEIAELRQKEETLKGQIEEEKKRRNAASIAADVLSSMENDASSKFRELARKAASFLDTMIPGAEIEISELSVDGIKMKDSGGELRQTDFLSSGARDCLMLGMRLCLAAESFGERDRIMLLDDPFLNLDAERTEKAIAALRSFHVSTGCQLVFFTKDENLLKVLEKDWRVKVHTL